MRGAGFLLGLVLVTASGRADEAADYLAAAGDEVNAFADCMVEHTKPFLASNEAPEALADEAMKSCGVQIDAVRRALKGPPANLSDLQAQETTKTVTAGMRATIIDEIRKRREE